MKHLELSQRQYERYARNIAIGEIGLEGQKTLLRSRITIIGAGGLGSSCALYLAAAGVGNLLIIDGDRVELSNLQRQIIHHTGDLGREKVDSARQKIEALNPDVKLDTRTLRVDSGNIRDLIRGSDFVIDASDNFPTKFLINDTCVLENIPFSHAGVVGFGGQALTRVPGSACYRCIFDSPPPPGSYPSPKEAGIIGSIAGLFGTIQATEAVKYLLGIGDLIVNRLLICDGLSMTFSSVEVERNSCCMVCGNNPAITKLDDRFYLETDERL
ncbi:MAG TPA: HesA/MoeB/ThiF family protein [Spirochaetota bacterium]|nr:HesA/MoeB/ThiF family protein [Spirochaetota bacterium]